MLFCLLLTVVGATSALVAPTLPHIRQIYDFKNKGSWLENLAVRPNGRILATRLDVPQLYQFNPQSENPEPTLIHTFPSTGLTGIAELSGHPDVFAVIAGNFTSQKAGSCSVWQVDMRQRTPKVTRIAQIPQAAVPNGVASLGAAEHSVLISDSTLNNVWRLNLRTGAYTLAITDPKMSEIRLGAGLGVNGIRVFGRHLYFINSYGPFLARIPIHDNGTAAGPSEIVGFSVASDLTFDDFAIDSDGTAYVATASGNSITRITPFGKSEIIAGNINKTDLANPTSVRFGRTGLDRRTIYVTTAGGLKAPVNGTVVVGAQLAAINLL